MDRRPEDREVRSRGRHPEVPLDDVLPTFHEDGDHAAPIDDWSPKVNDPCRQTEVRRALTNALDALPADARAAVILRDVEGLSMAELAAALGLTVTNAKTRPSRPLVPTAAPGRLPAVTRREHARA